jgi:hypothetical protein
MVKAEGNRNPGLSVAGMRDPLNNCSGRIGSAPARRLDAG